MDQKLVSLALKAGFALSHQGWRLAVAESCTGGGLAAAITSVSGSSAWFEEGVIAYANAVKVRELGVEQALLDSHGAVSEEVALAMARGISSRSGAEVAIATTGIAGPTGGSEEKPVGLVCFGYVAANRVWAESCRFSGSRNQIREQAVRHALRRVIEICERS